MDAIDVDVEHRWMIRRDLDDVVWIEERSYEQPWSKDHFLHCLRTRNVIGMVQESGGQITGYAVYEFNRREIDVLSFAIHPHFRRRGNGRVLLWQLKKKLNDKRRFLHATLSERNVTGQLFLRSCGFRVIETIDQLFDQVTDAYVFRFFGDYSEYTHNA